MVTRLPTANLRGPIGPEGPEGRRGKPGLTGIPGANAVPTDEAVGAYVRTPGTASEMGVAAVAGRKLLTELDLREWVDAGGLDNDEDGDNTGLFTQVMADVRALRDDDGIVREVIMPAGRYGFDARLSPPAGADGLPGYFAIRGEGMYRTVFVTAASNSWLGINQFQVGDPDWAAEHMYFSDFTIDGTQQPIGSAYSSGLKGFILHNIRDTLMERVRVFNTHATGFGIDYSTATLIDCVAEYCGRGRKTHDPDPTTRFGSGSGAGIGFGQKVDELVRLINFVARYNGAAGIFGEQLGQPEAEHKSIGLFVQGALTEYNAIGMNDTGTRGTQVTGLVTRYNQYAGYRVGISNASEQGGIDGQVKGLTSYGNAVGIALEGSAEGTYLFDTPEVFENARAGVEFRETTAAWPGLNLRFRAPHIHHNGGDGVLGSTSKPIVGLQMTDVLIHDNAGDGLSFVSPLSRPKISGRAFRNKGWAIALRGFAHTEHPYIDLDVHGSAGGGMLSQHIIDTTADVHVFGNPATVDMPVAKPIPDADTPAGTDWIGQTAGLTYAASFAGPDGVDLGPHIVGTATASSPRVIASPITVALADVITASVHVIAPKGKTIQPAVRFGSGGTAVWVAGPICRATGSVQRLSFTLAVPAGQTQARAGVIGATGVSTWGAGDILRATKVNITRGGQLWRYIDGNQPNCAWAGTAGASASTLTVPVYTPVLGFDDQFDRVDGAVGVTPQGKTWQAAVSSGTTVPLVIVGGKAKAGTGGNAPRTLHYVEGDGANGVFEAKIGSVGEHWANFIVRGTDASNYVSLAWARNSTTPTYQLTKRVAGTSTEVAYASSPTSADGDVVKITLAGTSVEVKVNGTTIFGGAQTIAEHAGVTTHGLLLVANSLARNESVEYIKFTPAA